LPIAENQTATILLLTLPIKQKHVNAETFRNPQMLIETNLKNALLKTFELRKALPTFLSPRLPNGPALSCGADNFHYTQNETSSC